MGLDISILTDNHEEVKSGDYWDLKNDYLNKHGLSRTVCHLMCRKDVISGEPELDQIGRITSVDISPIYEMETYESDNGEELEFFLEIADSDEERERILQQAKQNKKNLSGNIDKVMDRIETLIAKLASVDNLPDLLNDNGYDTLDSKYYFSDFNIDKGRGYIGNNFGQDLRNFKRFLEFAKSKGTKTVYFTYG